MSTTITPYLGFAGTTRDAFAFYEQALGGRIEAMLTFDDAARLAPAAPAAPAPEGCAGGAMPSGGGVMHASLALPGGARLFAGDVPPGMPHPAGNATMLAIQYDTVDQAHGAFHALSQGGQVTMPMAPSFWSKTFGMVTDRFGVSWAVNGEAVAFQ